MPTGAAGINTENRNMFMQMEGVSSEVGTGTASSAAVTINKRFGIITSEALTTAQNAVATVTLTNSEVAAGDLVLAIVSNGTNTQGTPTLTSHTVTASTVVFRVSNLHASAEALNGTIKIHFMVVKAL